MAYYLRMSSGIKPLILCFGYGVYVCVLRVLRSANFFEKTAALR